MQFTVKSIPGKEPNEWKVERLVDVGADEQFQARFLDLAEFFKMSSFNLDKAKMTSLNDAYWSMVLDGFTAAFVHLRQASRLASDPNTPKMNLRLEFNSFYSALWTAYQHRFNDLVSEMGYKIKFLFADREEDFQRKGLIFAEQHGLPPVFIPFLSEQRQSWQNKLSVIRNKVIQHAQIDAEKAAAIYVLETANRYFDYCWQTAEWVLAVLIGKHLPGYLEIATLPDELSEDGRKAFVLQRKQEQA